MSIGEITFLIGTAINVVVLLHLAMVLRKVNKANAEMAKSVGREEGRDEILNQLAGRVDRACGEFARQKSSHDHR